MEESGVGNESGLDEINTTGLAMDAPSSQPPIYILEDFRLEDLYPLTYTRPAALLRCGAETLLDRMLRHLPRPPSGIIVRDTIKAKMRETLRIPVNPKIDMTRSTVFINARWLMTHPFEYPPVDTAGMTGEDFTWVHLSPAKLAELDLKRIVRSRILEKLITTISAGLVDAVMIRYPWNLLGNQHDILLDDFQRRGVAKLSEPMPGAHLLKSENMYIGQDVQIMPGAVLDARNGPIIIERGVQIRANCVITGPVYIGPECVIRTGADIREDCAFGPGCRVGGEIIGSIFQEYSNKQHDGFLGQSFVGSWANLGAGTTTSNLKNTYGIVRVPISGKERITGLQFMGSIIGDHAKIGIGTMLSTGTVVGFASHILTSRPPKFIPSFAWVTDAGIEHLDYEKSLEIARTVMERRKQKLTVADEEIFNRIFTSWSQSESYRWRENATAQ
ncbi:MAG: putative sugar nucleotidyl transferase [Phycisphaerae bacterium]